MNQENKGREPANHLEGCYANYFQVGHNAFEFVLDFGQCYPEDTEAWCHTRIVTGPAYAKVLAETLRKSLDHYEHTFGVIPQDGESSETRIASSVTTFVDRSSRGPDNKTSQRRTTMSDETMDTTAESRVDSSDQATAESTTTSQASDDPAQGASASEDSASEPNTESQDATADAAAVSDTEGASGTLDATTQSGDTTQVDTSTPGAASTAQDPGQPYLFVDLYSGDDGRLVGKHPDWQVLANTPHYCGAILKAWDGLRFNDGGWFQRHWPAVRAAGADRYGETWFRGAYLFLEFAQSGADQADAYLQTVEAAGGWDSGDILPIIDAEQGGEGRPAMNGKPAVPAHPNRRATKQQVIDCVTACANRLRERIGRRVILYGRGAMRDLGINDRMGCDLVWNPAYTQTMVRHGLEAWNLEDVVLWQYCGDGTAAVANLPRLVPGFGVCDLSVFVKGAQRPTLQLVRDNLLA